MELKTTHVPQPQRQEFVMTIKSRLAGAALIAALALPVSALLPASLPFAPVSAHAGILATHEATLASYGTFFEHQKYGKVWMPSANVVPQGWHPYPPCNWVNTKYGWYFQDNTPWGAIVHHHGRWAHEPKVGWMWIPGEEFSPGWVIWKTSEQWVGWAPTPPDQDMKTLDADEFNTDKMWTFMDAKKFGKSCAGDAVVVASQVPVILAQTRYITEFVYVDGILVFVFPPWMVGPIVNINIDIDVWSPIFITTVINNWINIWNIVNINIACGPVAPAPIRRIDSSPPPAPPSPPGRRTETPPTSNPGGNGRPNDPPTLRPIPSGQPVYPGNPPTLRPIPNGPVYPGNPPTLRPTPGGPVNAGNPPTLRPNGPTRPINPGVIARPNGGGTPVLNPQIVNRPSINVSRPVKTLSPQAGSTVRLGSQATGHVGNVYRRKVM
jgi:hypothetical protein